MTVLLFATAAGHTLASGRELGKILARHEEAAS